MIFSGDVTPVEVTCWQCGHSVEFKEHELPAGITEHQLSEGAKCANCGAGWPSTMPLPRLLKKF